MKCPRLDDGRAYTFVTLGAAPATEPWWEANEVPETTLETRSFRKRTFKEYNREDELCLAANVKKILKVLIAADAGERLS